jgi:hypothetical protein
MTEDELVSAILNKMADRMLDPKLRRRRFYGTARSAAVDYAERVIGMQLPRLLRRLYLEVANGGFGFNAVLGVDGGYNDDGLTISSKYALFLANGWLKGILPIVGSEYSAMSCIDMRTADDRLVILSNAILTRTEYNLSSWCEAWIGGVDLLSELFEISYMTSKHVLTGERVKSPLLGLTKGVVIGRLASDGSRFLPTQG